MRTILALTRVNWLTFTSYKLNVVSSFLSLVALFVPIYLVAGALQPVVADSIADEGRLYFGFLITGMAAAQIVGASMRVLPTSISGGITSGTLEALLATPTPMVPLLIGIQGYGLLWSCVRCALLLIAFVLMGGTVSWTNVPLSVAVLILLALAHLPLALVAASMVLIFRTSGPLVQGATAAVSLLGGVYYSTSVIPEVVRPLAQLIPLTYGLRAFRRLLLSGAPLSEVASDLFVLVAMTVGFLSLGLALFAWSLRYARRAGSLAQY